MIVNSFKCDRCDVLKREVNGWFIMTKGSTYFRIDTWDYPPEPDAIDEADEHLCGAGCVQIAVQQWLSAQKEAQ